MGSDTTALACCLTVGLLLTTAAASDSSIPAGVVEVTGVLGIGNSLVELKDGSLLTNDGRTSQDGGKTWSAPQPGNKVSPVCCAIERYTLRSAGDDRDRILWTGPKGPERKNLVVRVSYDEGQTFSNERPISDQYAAYSDLTILKDKTIGVLWERGVKQGYEFITFTRFDLEFLEPKK